MNLAPLIKELREKTGVSMAICKKTLEQTKGDIEKALLLLRKESKAVYEKKAGRKAEQGLIEAYIHATGRVGVLVAVRCETDFVAKNENFKAFTHDIAMHIAASNPSYLSRKEVPANVLQEIKSIFEEETKTMGKKEEIAQKIVEGKMDNYFKEHVLLEQVFIKNQDIAMNEYVQEAIQKFGENIKIERFARFAL